MDPKRRYGILKSGRYSRLFGQAVTVTVTVTVHCSSPLVLYPPCRWKYLHVDGNDYFFDLFADERKRANFGKQQPERLGRMRADRKAWNASMPLFRRTPRSAWALR